MPRAIFGAVEGPISAYEKPVLSARVAGSFALQGVPVVRVRTFMPEQRTAGEAVSVIEVGRSTTIGENQDEAEAPIDAPEAGLSDREAAIPLPGHEEVSMVMRGIRHATPY